jgi:SH3 domain-containing YSC84-like protein 1
VNLHNQPRLFILMVVLAALTSVLATAQSVDDHEKKVREAAAQSVKAGKVFDAIMKNPRQGNSTRPPGIRESHCRVPAGHQGSVLYRWGGWSGVVSRRTRNGCSDPVFFRAGGGSVGPQVGASATDIVLLFMNEEAVGGLMKDKFELGAEAAVAGGPVGRDEVPEPTHSCRRRFRPTRAAVGCLPG